MRKFTNLKVNSGVWLKGNELDLDFIVRSLIMSHPREVFFEAYNQGKFLENLDLELKEGFYHLVPEKTVCLYQGTRVRVTPSKSSHGRSVSIRFSGPDLHTLEKMNYPVPGTNQRVEPTPVHQP